MADITEELIYEYWDCDKCGKKEIRGDLRACISCGSPRNESIKFYLLTSKEEKVEDIKQSNEFKAGPDWLCSFCNTLNSATKDSCLSCGSSKLDSEKNYFDIQKSKEEKLNKKNFVEPQKQTSSLKKIITWTIAGISTFIGGICFLTKTHDVKFQMKSVKWEITVPVSRYIRTEKIDWENSLTGDNIQKISSTKEIFSYEDRQVGTKTERYTDSESYQSGSKKECNTSYESTGSGASKKVTKCENVPTYSTRNVTKTRTVPMYQKFPIYANKIKYFSSSYAFLRNFTLSGVDNLPKRPDIELSVGAENKPDRKENEINKFEVIFSKLNKEDKALDNQAFLVSEDLFKTKYLLNSEHLKKVDIFDRITPEEGEARLEEDKK